MCNNPSCLRCRDLVMQDKFAYGITSWGQYPAGCRLDFQPRSIGAHCGSTESFLYSSSLLLRKTRDLLLEGPKVVLLHLQFLIHLSQLRVHPPIQRQILNVHIFFVLSVTQMCHHHTLGAFSLIPKLPLEVLDLGLELKELGSLVLDDGLPLSADFSKGVYS